MSVIKVENIYKDFLDGEKTIRALHETSFAIFKGEFVAIIGPSGSGKSTLLTILGALQRPSGGKIWIDGEDITSREEKDRADLRFKKIGFVLQASNLLPYLTVEEQLKLKDKYSHQSYNVEKAEQWMEKLGISRIRNKYPDQISGGERQRAAIAGALYNDPVVILADEPTASLDTEKAFDVVKLLSEISRNEGKTVVMVTHDQRLLQYCDRVLEIRDGRLTEKTV